MADLAVLGTRFESQGYSQAERELDNYAKKAGSASQASDALGQAQRGNSSATRDLIVSIERAVTELRDLHVGMAEGAMQALKEADALKQNAAAAKAAGSAHVQLATVHGKAVGSSRALQAATLNLSRQFTDIAVTGAMGMNPLMILIQQGPQAAEALGVIKAEGVGVAGAFKLMLAPLTPLLAALAPLAAVAGAAAGGFLLLNRELQKGFPKDITDGLNLTEEQLKRVEDRTVTMGDVWASTLDVMGKYLTSGPIGEGLDWLQEKWSQALDWMANFAFEATARIVGFFVGAYRAIIANWRNFPAILGDVFTMAVNFAIDAVQRLLNSALKAINALFDVLRLLPQYSWLPRIPEADLSSWKGQVSGAAEFFGDAFAASISQAIEDVRAGMRRLGEEISSGAVRRATDRALEQAGEASKKSGKAMKEAGDITVREIKLISANLEDFMMVPPKVEGTIKHMTDLVTADIDHLQGNIEFAASQMEDAFLGVANAVDRVFYSISSQNWGGAVGGIIQAMKAISSSTSSVGLLGTIGNIAGAVAPHVGGSLGSTLGTVSAIGQLGGLGSLLGTGSAGGLSGFMSGIGGALASNPIGWAVLAASLAASFLGGKPSNNGAGYDLTTGQLSGDKRTSETENAAKTAGDAILQIQDTLKAAGISLTTTVRGLVIGTRDLTQIYLTNGQTLTSAVGDASAAVETAMKALLDGATYADEQQKILVQSMQAAGKGFEEIAAALETYASAQGLSKTLADAILQFTDPQAYAVSQLEASQEERRQQVQDLYDQLYLTADQFASLNAQLTELEALELADTLAGFTDSLASAISAAESELQAAYQAEVQALQATISSFERVVSSLRSFDASLRAQQASNVSPLVAYTQAQGAFRSIVSSTDPAVLAGIPQAGQAYLQAALAIAPDKQTYARVLAEVRAGVAEAEKYATDQIDAAEAQLEELKKQVEILISIDGGVKTVAQAIAQLGTLLTQQNGGSASTLPEWFDWQKYAADNPDLAAAYNSGAALTEFGSFEEAVKQHYLLIGQKEIAAGTRYYASGTDSAAAGWAWVGEQGPELIRMRGGEGVISNSTLAKMASGGDPETKVLLRQMISETAANRNATEKLERFFRGVTNDGRSLNTTAA